MTNYVGGTVGRIAYLLSLLQPTSEHRIMDVPRCPGKSAMFKLARKYKPHQGKRECARRMRQMSGQLESKPRRMWVLSNMFGYSIGFAKEYLWMSKSSTRKPLAKSKLARKYPIALVEVRV